MAPQSPVTSRGLHSMRDVEPPYATHSHRYTAYPRYHLPRRELYDTPSDDMQSYERPHIAEHPSPWQAPRERPTPRSQVVCRFKRSSAAVAFESSPSATPHKLPTIDVLCGVSTKKRLSSGTFPGKDASPFTHDAPSRNDHLTRANDMTAAAHRRPLSRETSGGSSEDTPAEEDAEDEPTSVQPATKKRQRYLRDVDRRSSILRIENGEKQAALAREFGVTRAAICHIKKNRDEIVSRYESLLESAKEMERAGKTSSSTTSKDAPTSVVELTRPSVLLLLTTLRDVATSPRAFRASAERLMMVLLEEAVASGATVTYDLQTTTGQTVRGVKADHRVCCVAVGQKGLPLVQLYRQLDPRGSVGCVELAQQSHRGEVLPVVAGVDLPHDMASDACVLLVSCSTATGKSVCAAIQALVDDGIAENNIRVVVLACTTNAATLVSTQYPGVRLLTCAVETTETTTLRDFLERYDALERERERARHPSRRPHQYTYHDPPAASVRPLASAAAPPERPYASHPSRRSSPRECWDERQPPPHDAAHQAERLDFYAQYH